ncbi:MAG: hypothetical protein HC898_08695, partial [Phycisphaerales bacterium]|nr:hypothetical protein [Phycisphaerales bacterium]
MSKLSRRVSLMFHLIILTALATSAWMTPQLFAQQHETMLPEKTLATVPEFVGLAQAGRFDEVLQSLRSDT